MRVPLQLRLTDSSQLMLSTLLPQAIRRSNPGDACMRIPPHPPPTLSRLLLLRAAHRGQSQRSNNGGPCCGDGWWEALLGRVKGRGGD